jgi:ABC-2 type transport system ATP-binding protein
MSGVISVRGLVKRYGSKTVVDGLDLEVSQGAIYAFLGDNGAGKTSTIKVLVGMHPADGGTARILGQDCWARAVSLRHRVGYVAERPRFYEWMTVTEIGWFTASFHRAGFLDRYQDWALRLGLDTRKRLRDLSKGGYARVALALALAPDPEVLILDEPTSGLDLLTRRDFLASMVDLAANGRTILISSHGISELERIASHVGLLSHGKLLFSGPVDDIKRRFTRLQFRAADDPVVAGLGTVLHRQTLGRQLDLLIQDPTVDAAERLRAQEGVSDVEEAVPGLEDIYAAVMRNAGHATPGVPI